MNRLKNLFGSGPKNLLSVYFTAGYPQRDDTIEVLRALDVGGADIVEIGIPFSDPVADGPTIQESNRIALENGMTMDHLFTQLEGMREETELPVILMGYLNPVIQYGIEAFASRCKEVGIDGLIIPDLPVIEYEEMYKPIFDNAGLSVIFLVSPATSEGRIRQIDAISDSFIYLVSSASITGAKKGISDEQVQYFERIRKMELSNPTLVGFGISNRESFSTVCQYSSGAIIGSAFINRLTSGNNLSEDIVRFIGEIKLQG